MGEIFFRLCLVHPIVILHSVAVNRVHIALMMNVMNPPDEPTLAQSHRVVLMTSLPFVHLSSFL